MNPFINGLKVIISYLSELQIPYMVFGGIANSLYGNPRQTFDIDIKIALDSPTVLENLIAKINAHGKVIPQNPRIFIDETGVLPIEVEGVRIDLVFAKLPFELEAIQRSQKIPYSGLELQICTLEDLINS